MEDIFPVLRRDKNCLGRYFSCSMWFCDPPYHFHFICSSLALFFFFFFRICLSSFNQLPPSSLSGLRRGVLMAATGSTMLTVSVQPRALPRSASKNGASPSGCSLYGVPLREHLPKRSRALRFVGTQVRASAAVAASPMAEIKEYTLPTWAQFELGRAPVYWKTMNGLPPTSGQKLRIFYNPAAKKIVPNEEFGIAFNGGFNQPIMCGGEPRAMLQKTRGVADPPFYTIQICVPKHALNLIFSFTNGTEWDGPYRLQFQIPKAWQNKPASFFNEGLAEELSKDSACDGVIFPDTNKVITRCAMIGNLTVEGGDRCNLDFVVGCTDPTSHLYNPLANVDDGSCPVDSDFENDD